MYLPDVNVWVALVVTDHQHHRAARAWFERVEDESAVFCRISQISFLRILSAPAVSRGMVTPAAAWKTYWQLRSDARVTFEPEPGLESRWEFLATLAERPLNSGWSDSYLAAFAIERGHTFVTFDKGFRRFPSLDLTLLEA